MSSLVRTELSSRHLDLPATCQSQDNEQEIPVRDRRSEQKATRNTIPDHRCLLMLFSQLHHFFRYLDLAYVRRNSHICLRLVKASNSRTDAGDGNTTEDEDHENIRSKCDKEEHNEHASPTHVVDAESSLELSDTLGCIVGLDCSNGSGGRHRYLVEFLIVFNDPEGWSKEDAEGHEVATQCAENGISEGVADEKFEDTGD